MNVLFKTNMTAVAYHTALELKNSFWPANRDFCVSHGTVFVEIFPRVYVPISQTSLTSGNLKQKRLRKLLSNVEFKGVSGGWFSVDDIPGGRKF